MKGHITYNNEETKQIGENYSASLKGGEVLCLYGQLGSGKTTFTQGLAHGFGIKKRLLSPTYIIVRHYKIKRTDIHTLYHLDLYRLENESEITRAGLHDYLHKKENIVVIEWPEKMGKFLPKKRIDIHFKDLGDDKREISIKKTEYQNPKYETNYNFKTF